MNRSDLAERLRLVSTEQFSRSGGPGGQHVNKANTQVTLYLPLDELGLSGKELERVRGRLANRLDSAGRLVIRSSETRSQKENRERAAERALSLIEGARHPSRTRRRTKPSRAAEERRLRQKQARSKRKRERRRNRRPPAEE